MPAFAFGVFLLSRLWLMTWPELISDTALYYQLAMRTTYTNFVIYRDYAFAYPTLSWLSVKWPALLSRDLSFEDYRFYFRLQLCLAETALAAALFFAAARKWKSHLIPSKTILIYTALSLCMGNLLYDRIDLLMVFALIFVFIGWPRGATAEKLSADVGYLVGFFVKLIPVGLWPFQMVDALRVRKSKALVWLWLPVVCAGGIWALDQWYTPGMVDALALHTVRGIQIESLWASPYLLAKITGLNDAVQIVMFMGAHEVDAKIINETYTVAAKAAGFAALIALFGVYVWKKVNLVDLRARAGFFLLFIFCFLAFQRVLSTQFFIWATPFAALWLALRWNWFFFAFCALQYALTYILFGQVYLDIVKFDPVSTSILIARNVCVLILFGQLVLEFWGQCKNRPAEREQKS